MPNDLKTQKENLRAEAKRARGLLSLNAEQQDSLCNIFFDHIDIDENTIIAAYWPKGRELDTLMLVDSIIEKGAKVALPIIEKGSRVLKFARWHDGIDLIAGDYGINHPVIDKKTEWLEPDIFIIPVLAFDRRGNRLGYGGGYYDATLESCKESRDITAIGLAYAKQACLFNLPLEDHDIKMDWIITEQSATRF